MTKNEDEPLVDPKKVVSNYLIRTGISLQELGVAPLVVLSWGRGVVAGLAELTQAKLSPHWFYGERNPLYHGECAGKPISIVQMPVGAPGTVMILEELIACGARTVIGLGWAGGLQSEASIGSLIIPTSCLSEEGTSLHYFEEEIELVPDPGLVSLLVHSAKLEGVTALAGPLWTTDAPYRELRYKVNEYQRQGILGVDMETSAMYALGIFRKIRVCNMLVVSDMLAEEWDEAFGTERLQNANRLAQQIILRALAAL
ncbi:MAG: nucleoside phosphorylase [Anaerolineales bacterium]|nr:MAG: nucleoside phosphorylase [Anaerolineales bacterium]